MGLGKGEPVLVDEGGPCGPVMVDLTQEEGGSGVGEVPQLGEGGGGGAVAEEQALQLGKGGDAEAVAAAVVAVAAASGSGEPGCSSSSSGRPPPLFLARFCGAWVYTEMATVAVSLMEKQKKYREVRYRRGGGLTVWSLMKEVIKYSGAAGAVARWGRSSSLCVLASSYLEE